MISNTILTVSQINSYIKLMFQGDKQLRNIFVTGEIFDFKENYSSGHAYFSLKENKNIIRAVMFASDFMRIKFIPEDGMTVIVHGGISAYEKTGQYQLYVKDMQPAGLGVDYAEVERLKEKLKNEGLFSDERKRNIPNYPMRLGIITSMSGAVVHDIENVINRRYPFCKIDVFPIQVQGENSEKNIISAIEYFNNSKNKPDTIIIARGGGSSEDLGVFNREGIARAVAASEIPTISAIGHETDWTICDFVADMRAPTPSAAAELAVPDKNHLLHLISTFEKRLFIAFENIVNLKKRKLRHLEERLQVNSPKNNINLEFNKVLLLQEKLNRVVDKILTQTCAKIDVFESRLEAVNPLKVLLRGYTFVDGGDKVINKISDLSKGQTIQLRFIDGIADVVIKDVRRDNIGR